jgi:general secretion pathway protein K
MQSESGVALIISLLVVVLLMVMASEFSHYVGTELKVVTNFKEEMERYYLAEAGVYQALAEIAGEVDFHYLDENGHLKFGKLRSQPQPEEKPENASQEVNATEPPNEIPLGRGTFSYTIEDEERKLNINLVSRQVLVELLTLSGVEDQMTRDTIADSIIDWRDPDHNHLLNGAEDDYYETLDPPYEAKDANFDTLEELLLVKGMTREILYGTDLNSPSQNKDEKKPTYTGIAQYLTTDSSGQININTASEPVIRARYKSKTADLLLDERKKEGYFKQPKYAGIVKSSHFTILSTGRLKNDSVGRTIKVVVEYVNPNSGFKILYWNDNFQP